MNERDMHHRASEAFVRIRDLPRGDRPAALDALALESGALAQEVRSLLAHDDTGHGTSGVTSGANDPTVDPTDSETMDPSRAGAARPADLPHAIGPYRILDRIGSGGSGLVLLAEQHEPVRRRVAIKIVPHAAISPELAARFEFERRSLEKTDHPNIARILDAGRTTEGLPYLVMDYVEGVAITEHCRRYALDMRARIELMIAVADAVQHAHQRGVIHRDLKPANILVSRVDGRDTPRVLDFGIAKSIPGVFGESTPQTLGMPIGTPAYMAPEQASGGTVDTRADVYALGAILFELTSGRTPIGTGGAMLDVLKRIRDEVPEPASRVRARHPDRFEHDSTPRWVLSDLDCVIARALEKNPERRYAAVSDLGLDLSRILRSEPIDARPPTMRYRAATFARRRKGLVVAMGVAAAALALGFLGLWLGLLEADRQRAEAVRQAETLAEVNRFITEDLLGQASPFERAPDEATLALLKRAGERVDARLADRPLIAAGVHNTLGIIYSELSEYDDAERHLHRSLELGVLARPDDRAAPLRTRIALASLMYGRQQYQECVRVLEGYLPEARSVLGESDPWLYRLMNDLGAAYEALDRGPEAVATLENALQGQRRLLDPNDKQILIATMNLAAAYDRVGKTAESLEMQIETLRIAEAGFEPPPMIVLGLCNNIGATMLDLRRDAEAAEYLRRAEALVGDLLEPDDPGALTIRGNLAGLETRLGNPGRGAELYREVVEVRTRQVGADAPDTLVARYGVANALFKDNQFEAAIADHSAILADSIRVNGPTHWFTAQTRYSLALALKHARRPEEAVDHARLAAEQFTALYGTDHERSKTAISLYAELTAPPP